MNPTGELDFEIRVRERLSRLSESQRETLLRYLCLAGDDRAARIGQLYQADHTDVASVLIDAEVEPLVRLTLMEQLHILSMR
jgi:hypothetical protein